MKISLIYLPHPNLVRPNMMAPLGLLYVAAAFEKVGAEVSVENFSGETYEKALDKLPQSDIYGITITSLEAEEASKFAEGIKKRFPSSKVILGGPGTVTPELIDMASVDSLVQGEGEIAAEAIFNDFTKRGALDKLYRSPTVLDLDRIPIPARHLVKSNFSTLSIITSRGCPFSCSFCASPKLANNKMRYRSIANVINEISMYGASELVIHDDMFTANKTRMIELCNQIGKLGVKFRINIRSKPLDVDMLKAAKDAGCNEAAIGVESFDDVVLKTLKKNTTVADNVNALWLLDKVGIDARLLLMVRTPGQTKETLAKNRYWLTQVPHKLVACTNFIPIPGCDVWYNPDKYNIEILTKDLKLYNYGFFDSNGEIPLLQIFKLKDRSIEEFHNETKDFKEWLNLHTRINKG